VTPSVKHVPTTYQEKLEKLVLQSASSLPASAVTVSVKYLLNLKSVRPIAWLLRVSFHVSGTRYYFISLSVQVLRLLGMRRVQVLLLAVPVRTIHIHHRLQVQVPHRVITLRVPACRILPREFLRIPVQVQVQIRLIRLRVPSYAIQSSQILYGLPPVCTNQVCLRSFLRIMNKFQHKASLHFLPLGQLLALEGDFPSSSSFSIQNHYFVFKRSVQARIILFLR
jgi:hypothetical protein